MTIDKEEFKQLIIEGLTIPELQVIYGVSRSKIAEYKKAFGFVGLTPNSKKIDREVGVKFCTSCNTEKPLSEFYSNGKSPNGTTKYKPKCSTCENSIRKNTWWEYISRYLKDNNKTYSCESCGESDSFGFLDFHHTVPEEKSFTIGSISNYTNSYDYFLQNVVPEIQKCRLLCPNCHRREHLVMCRN